MRALIVEDQKQMRTIIRRMLQQMKYFEEIHDADDGEEAWLLLTKDDHANSYGFVLSDVNLPRLDGIELLKRCRNDPTLNFLPFIMVSASAHGELVVSALGEWGANDFIVKPFSHEVLSQRVGVLLKRMESPEEHLFRQAEELKRNGQTENALKVIKHWEAESRISRARWLNLKGECLMESGQEEKAALQFEKAMATSSIFISAYKNYAIAHEKLGNIDKSIKALKQVESLSPTNSERTLILGRLLLQAGQEEEGRKLLQGLIKRSGGTEKESALKKVAEIFLEGGLFEDAEATYIITLKMNPADLDTSNRLAIALRQQEKYDEAEQCYLDAIKSHPKHAGIYHNLGVLFSMRKNYEKAEASLKKALKLDPDFEGAKSLLANVLDKRKKVS